MSLRSLSVLHPVLLLPLVMACAEAPLEPASPGCDEVLSGRAAPGEVLLMGGGGQPLEEVVLTDRDSWRAYRKATGLPNVDVDFSVEQLHVVELETRLSCETIDDTRGQLEVVRLDDGDLGMIVPLVRSSDDCRDAPQPLHLVIALPLEESGRVVESCLLR